jgi:hypothetical protein
VFFPPASTPVVKIYQVTMQEAIKTKNVDQNKGLANLIRGEFEVFIISKLTLIVGTLLDNNFSPKSS